MNAELLARVRPRLNPAPDTDAPQAWLAWLVEESACDVCGSVRPAIPAQLATLTVQRNGYTIRHRARWKLCSLCLLTSGNIFRCLISDQDREVFRNALADLIIQQPMQEPSGQIFYMDFVYEQT